MSSIYNPGSHFMHFDLFCGWEECKCVTDIDDEHFMAEFTEDGSVLEVEKCFTLHTLVDTPENRKSVVDQIHVS